MSIFESIKAKFKKNKLEVDERMCLINYTYSIKRLFELSKKEWGNSYIKSYDEGRLYVNRSGNNYEGLINNQHYFAIKEKDKGYIAVFYEKNLETGKYQEHNLVLNKNGKILAHSLGTLTEENEKKLLEQIEEDRERNKLMIEHQRKQEEQEAKDRYFGGYI